MPNLRGKRDSSKWPPVSDYADASDDIMLKVALEEAKLASEEIDHTLSVEQSRRKKDKAIRILLLGVYAVSLPSSGSESCRRPCRVFHAVTLTLTRV